jgi:hypothetical protein
LPALVAYPPDILFAVFDVLEERGDALLRDFALLSSAVIKIAGGEMRRTGGCIFIPEANRD